MRLIYLLFLTLISLCHSVSGQKIQEKSNPKVYQRYVEMSSAYLKKQLILFDDSTFWTYHHYYNGGEYYSQGRWTLSDSILCISSFPDSAINIFGEIRFSTSAKPQDSVTILFRDLTGTKKSFMYIPWQYKDTASSPRKPNIAGGHTKIKLSKKDYFAFSMYFEFLNFGTDEANTFEHTITDPFLTKIEYIVPISGCYCSELHIDKAQNFCFQIKDDYLLIDGYRRYVRDRSKD